MEHVNTLCRQRGKFSKVKTLVHILITTSKGKFTLSISGKRKILSAHCYVDSKFNS
jgi:hypothetical protein